MKISPELIPHTDFHTGVWLQSAERASWYYFKKQRNPNTITNKDFIKSVDEPLKELVKFLHRKGIKTTPSCSGHHISERDLEKIYNELLEDSLIIKSRGLNFKDIETGRLYFCRDKNYVLPWKKENFLKRVEIYQQKGVLGLRLGNRKKVKTLLVENLKENGVKVVEKDSTLFIFTEADRQDIIKTTWRKITRLVKKILST